MNNKSKPMILVAERAKALANVLVELENTDLDCVPQLKAFIKMNIDDMAKCLTSLSEEFTE